MALDKSFVIFNAIDESIVDIRIQITLASIEFEIIDDPLFVLFFFFTRISYHVSSCVHRALLDQLTHML